MAKGRRPLGDNPLGPVDPDTPVRDMVRGAPQGTPQAPKQGASPRDGKTTVTAGGLLRKTVYFSEDEWAYVRRRAYEEDRPYSDIVRAAVRQTTGDE